MGWGTENRKEKVKNDEADSNKKNGKDVYCLQYVGQSLFF